MRRDPEAIGRTGLAVLDRLKATARNRGEDARLLIVRYMLQRFLHRMSASDGGDTLVIKGGMMMPLLGAGTRPTEDIDGHSHVALDIGQASALLAGICGTDPAEEDGVEFDAAGMRIQEIRDGLMPGFRATVTGSITPVGGKPTRVPIKIDICFGDVITPEPTWAELPSVVKGFAPVRVSVYPWPTVVAEKLHALARHGVFTTRLKDLYDLVLISRSVTIDGADMSSAIANTFGQWGNTPPGDAASVLVPSFAADRSDDWDRYLKKKGANTLDMPGLRDVVAEIRGFAAPALEAAAAGQDLEGSWIPGGGWDGMSGPSAPSR